MRQGSGRSGCWRCLLVPVVLLSFGCISPPEADPSSTVLWGHVRLVPKAGSQVAGGGYGDRRVADVKRVDYSETKFAVVFAPEAKGGRSEPAELVVARSDDGPHLEPPFAATSPSAGIRITNSTDSRQIVSVPDAARIERIEPGASVVVDGLAEGELSVHMLGVHGPKAPSPVQIWVTEGLRTEVEASGRYTLRGLAPGRHSIRAWHPRLPPSPAHPIGLERGSVVRLDLEIGLDAEGVASGEAR